MNTTKLDLNKLHPFAGHPYKVQDNEEMDVLMESIRMNGILTPLIVRPLENGEYEVISGHRRLYAARKAGLETVPAIILPMSRDKAAVALVDSNLHREHLLPSEKAFAYKLKMEALHHQGVTSGQVGQKWSRDAISDADSGRQVQRYIRLTHLIPSILSLVDEGQIAFTPAVELSYLTQQEQQELAEEMAYADATPSLSQAQRMRDISRQGRLTTDVIYAIMSEEKANQKERLKIPMERIRRFFPKSYTIAQIEDTIVKLCETYYRRRTDRDR